MDICLLGGEGKGGENITPGYEERAVSFNKNICNNKVSIINYRNINCLKRVSVVT